MGLKFSIITVSLNSRSTIKETILSVLGQCYSNIEYIVVDGDSFDGTQDIVKSFAHGVDHFISEKDSGIYNAMNKGLTLATGDIVFFLNSDDIFIDEDVVSDISKVFTQSPELEVVYGDQIFKIADQFVVKKQNFKITRKQLAAMTIQHQTIFARKELFQRTKNFSEKYPIVSDYDWILNAFLKQRVRYQYINRAITVMGTEGMSWKYDFEDERRWVMKNYFTLSEIYLYRVLPQLVVNFTKKVKKIVLGAA
ncbi:MAG: glycosyltransferase [Desulfobulbaceae bacterium]|nr:glycosyltransferase [Desulfobulbaceae bacterium]